MAAMPQRSRRTKVGISLATSRRRQAASLSRRELRQRSFVAKRRVLTNSAASTGSLESALSGLKQCVDDCSSAERVALALQSLQSLRALLTAASDELALDAVVASGVVPFLAALVEHPTADSLRIEACWCLANIAAGDGQHAHAILPAAEIMVRIVSAGAGTPASLIDAAVWCIGNLAAEEDATRGSLLRLGAVAPIVRITADASVSLSTTRMAAWSLSNLARTRPAGSDGAEGIGRIFSESGAISALVLLLQRALSSAVMASEETRAECARVASEVAWAMMFLSAQSPLSSNLLQSQGALPLLIQLLLNSTILCGPHVNEQARVLLPTLRCLGNAIGSAASTEARDGTAFSIAAAPGVLPKLFELLTLGTPASLTAIAAAGDVAVIGGGLSGHGAHRWLCMDAAWVVGQLAAVHDPELTIISALAKAGFIPILAHILSEAPFDISRRAAFALRNMCCTHAAPSGVSLAVVEAAVRHGAVQPFLRLFEENDIALVMCGLDIVERLLALPSLPHGGASDDVERDADMMDGPHLIESSDGILALEQLQFRFSSDGAAGSGDIYTRTSGLLDTYFGEAYGDEDAGGYDGGFDAGEWSSAAWDVTLAMGAAGVSAAAAVAPPPRPTTKPAWMT